jgi:hypothetical protein
LYYYYEIPEKHVEEQEQPIQHELEKGKDHVSEHKSKPVEHIHKPEPVNTEPLNVEPAVRIVIN